MKSMSNSNGRVMNQESTLEPIGPLFWQEQDHETTLCWVVGGPKKRGHSGSRDTIEYLEHAGALTTSSAFGRSGGLLKEVWRTLNLIKRPLNLTSRGPRQTPNIPQLSQHVLNMTTQLMTPTGSKYLFLRYDWTLLAPSPVPPNLRRYD